MLTKDQALDELAKLQATGKVTTKKLMELAAQVSLDTAPGFTQGSVTVLYSGTINGVSSTEYIGDMIKQNADIRVIDKTNVGQFLADDEFYKAWKAAGGTALPRLQRPLGQGFWSFRRRHRGRSAAPWVCSGLGFGICPDRTQGDC